MLVDVVSRNGNLLLNFPLPNSGALDNQELVILEEITQWMKINGEAIYASRPWMTFGEGPGDVKPDPKQKYRETNMIDFTEEDVAEHEMVWQIWRGRPVYISHRVRVGIIERQIRTFSGAQVGLVYCRRDTVCIRI